MRLNIPSYMRAPPEAATMITAQRWVVPYSIVRVIATRTDALILRELEFRNNLPTARTLLKHTTRNLPLLAGLRLDCWFFEDCHGITRGLLWRHKPRLRRRVSRRGRTRST